MKKNTLLILALLALLPGCQKKAEATTDSKDSVAVLGVLNAKNKINYEGMYKGILPCADCEGLEMCISLNENATYSIKSKYLGKGNKIFEQHGTFTWNKLGNIIT